MFDSELPKKKRQSSSLENEAAFQISGFSCYDGIQNELRPKTCHSRELQG